MADETKFGPDVPETTFAYNDFQLDPGYHNATDKEPPRVWPDSQRMREIVEAADPRPPAAVRDMLVKAIYRQVRSLQLFRAVGEVLPVGKQEPRPDNELTLYVILFPGEGKDNTGIKDLNDKVLGYGLTTRFLDNRNRVIAELFTTTGPGSSYRTLGQDYKTCFILALGKKPEEVAADLRVLDRKIVTELVKVIDEALGDPTFDEAKKVECRKLKRALSKKGYRFDYLIGSRARVVQGDQLNVTFLLITEALKSAGLARVAVKAATMENRLTKEPVAGKVPKPKVGDDRSRPYDEDVYLRVSAVAPAIKSRILSSGTRDQPFLLSRILVDKVWTDAFLLFERLFFGNPDVIRDVRKKALVQPKVKQGVGAVIPVKMLELWLIILNLIDFVSGFLKSEYRGSLLKLHRTASNLVDDLRKNADVKWQRLTPVLTMDVRQKFPVAQLGATSEFPFFAYSSDYMQQIFFTFDVRDLGVDLMLIYELANKRIVDDQLTNENLMAVTFISNNRTLLRKRDTYDQVVQVFKDVHDRIVKRQDDAHRASLAAVQAAGAGVFRSGGRIPDFAKSIQVMIGGDEIFVAAHPLYAGHVSEIIRTLDGRSSADEPLNLRAGVGFSAAEPAAGPGPTFGPQIPPDQRTNNQRSHDRALNAASNSTSALKPFERRQRRMERLIDMLEDSRDTKKHDLVPGYRKRLDDLHLLRMYARAQHGSARPLPDAMYGRLIQALRNEDVPTALRNGEELIDFETGKPIEVKKLEADADKLEADLLRDAGRDNFQVAPPLMTKIPKVARWILKVVIRYLTGAAHPILGPEDKDEQKEEEIIA
jgi:hypothetical protein